MGGKSKPTIGYWYDMLLHFGLCRGPIDALLEFRGGEKTAWSGEATGGTLAINARELWGGEKAEGGIEGELDVMLGGADQEPSARLAGILGDQQSAFRGRATVAFQGLYGAFNPYPKPASWKVRRIFEGWDDDTCWYPEKAAVDFGESVVLSVESDGWEYQSIAHHANPGYDNLVPPESGWTSGGVAPFGSGGWTWPGQPAPNSPWPVGTILWVRRTVTIPAGRTAQIRVRAENGCVILVNGQVFGWVNRDNPQIPLGDLTVFSIGPGTHSIAIKAFDESPTEGDTYLSAEFAIPASKAMNPAHIIYFALTSAEMQGEPVASIDEGSFSSAADLFYDEGFGLCPRYNPVTQTPEDFIARICSVAGATCSRSRVDGKYYLIPRRGVHDLESLPILEDDDILEYEEEPSDPLEAVNQVTVEWFDPITKQKRTTSPIQSLGAIQALGGVVAESLSYPEIPVESLSLRVGSRDLAQKSTPLKRFRLTTNRVPYAWRTGGFFRLQAPRRGIADMVCEVGEIDAGTPRSGTMRLVAIQEVSRMPATAYVVAEPGVDTSPSPIPAAPPAQHLLEAPYVELAGDLPAGELTSLAEDAGFILAVAARPSSGINYTLYTAAAGEELADQGTGDWCPTALVVEAGTRAPGQTEFTLEEGFDLARVAVGSAALWGGELVRVDAIDASALTVTLGRGCGDTTPGLHAAGTRIWFYDTWAASDRREYAGGETVSAKLRTRTSSQLLDATLAPTLTVDLDERAIRPYPPGGLAITDAINTAAVNPSACFGELTVAWAHRDRLLQADQLVDAAAAGIGPEAGTTYTVRVYLNDVLDGTESGITGTSATPYTPSGNGLVRVEVEAVRDGYVSWQAAVAEFSYAMNTNDTRVVVGGDRRIAVGGDARTSRG